MKQKNIARNLKGFSLIEVMVAVVIMGMMGSLLMSTINASIKAKDAVEDMSLRYQLVRQALSRMTREISMAYLSKHINLVEPAFVTQFKGKTDKIAFSAFGNVIRQKDAKQSDEQVLSFYLATDKRGRQSLMRRHHPNLNLDVDKGGVVQVLCPNVKKIVFSYYDDRFDKWDETWVADPSTMAAQERVEGVDKEQKKDDPLKEEKVIPKTWRLPRYIKITLTAEMVVGVDMTWVTETEIPIQEPLDLH